MLGDKWKALTETERKPYDAKAATDKKRYEEEKAKYNAVSSPPPLSLHGDITSPIQALILTILLASRRGG